MKVLINENTENKLHSFYQNKIDDEWNVLKQRYKDEEVSSGNWYLSYINVIDRIKVTMVKVMSHRVLIFVDVYGDRVDTDHLRFVNEYFTHVLEPFGKPTVISVE
jgi:hypothetical protein